MGMENQLLTLVALYDLDKAKYSFEKKILRS